MKRLNPIDDELRAFAKTQRSEMTRAEAIFWEAVRARRFHGLKFKRQVPIGPYIVDFLCAAHRLIVELDGKPHETRERCIRDAERDRWLQIQGFHILRFSNDVVLGSAELAFQEIASVIDGLPAPSPASLRSAPSPAEGRGKLP